MNPLKRISLVEDDDDIRAIAEIALADIGGFELQMCASGEEAVEKVPGFAPDLLLLDVRMPGMSGPQTLGHLRQRSALADLPAIFMTADNQGDQTRNLLAEGALAVISKPFDPMQLAAELSGLWQDFQNGKQQ
ncbi:MAG: response regulator [Rhizobiales bacterium]|nr:response regulator [Hyphomicrobiales bacterium]